MFFLKNRGYPIPQLRWRKYTAFVLQLQFLTHISHSSAKELARYALRRSQKPRNFKNIWADKYRAYNVAGMAEATSQWHHTLTFLSVFFLKIWALSVISAFYCNTRTRETRLMQMLWQGFQSHLYWFTILNNTTVKVRHKRTKAFLGKMNFAGLEKEIEELEPSVGFLPSSIQSFASSEI